MTVTETDALLYLPGHPRQQVLRALRIPALSAGWKSSFQEHTRPVRGSLRQRGAWPKRARRRRGPGSGRSP